MTTKDNEFAEAVMTGTGIKKAKKKKPSAKKDTFVKNKPFNSKLLMKMVLDARIKDGLSLAAAANLADLSKSSLHQVEATGRCLPDMLPKICNWLKIPVQTFF